MATWHVGDLAECYSVTHAAWCKGEVVDLKTDGVVVRYHVPGGKHSTKLILFGHPDLRKPPGAFGSATATSPMSPARSSVTGGAQRSFPKEPPPVSLEEIPSLGERQLGEVQDETLLRLRRLLRHGDLRGAQRALQRAKLLNMETKEEEETVKQLESEGEFALLSS